MAYQGFYTVGNNVNIANGVYMTRLCGPVAALKAPGQFVNIKIEGFYLRRPISVCRWGESWIDLVYKVVGGGTARLAATPPGTKLDILTGLGNGFDVSLAEPGARVVLVGGGVGTPPLLGLAEALVKRGVVPRVVLGFASAGDVLLRSAFEQLGCAVAVATEDGSEGQRGTVAGLLEKMHFERYYACGPGPMLNAVQRLLGARSVPGQLSYEEKMGCGFGVCMGCTCHTQSGPKRVCADGPVFDSGEVVAE